MVLQARKVRELQGHGGSTKLRSQETRYQGQIPWVGLLSGLSVKLLQVKPRFATRSLGMLETQDVS